MRCGRSSALSSNPTSPLPHAPTPHEGQTFVGESLLVRYVNFVKLPHTIFALPFALLGVVVASYRAPVTWRTLGLVVLAFTCARFVALGFNRIADRTLDARNPRTRARELPSGRLTLAQAWVAVVLAAALFLWAAWALTPLSYALALVALVVFGLGAGLGVAYYAGVAIGAALMVYEHLLVKPGDLSRLNAAFFTANGIVSVVVFLGALVDRIV